MVIQMDYGATTQKDIKIIVKTFISSIVSFYSILGSILTKTPSIGLLNKTSLVSIVSKRFFEFNALIDDAFSCLGTSIK
jgi:hypothetical protein